ncbi:MAG: hypothetical protein ACREPQ_00565 [Rhodanobacter sp.]
MTGSANQLDAALRRLREVDASRVPGYSPWATWEHLRDDAAFRGLCVQLEVIQKDYGEGLWERFQVRYVRPDGRDLPVTGVFAADGKLELYLHDVRVPGCFATRDRATQGDWLEQVFTNYSGLLGAEHAGHMPFTVPLDWNGGVQVKGCVLESDGCVSWAESIGQPPSFYGVYAGRTPGGYRNVADFDNAADAEKFAACLTALGKRYGNTMPELWDRRRYDVPLWDGTDRSSWDASWSFTESAKAQAEGWDLVMDRHTAVIAAVPDNAKASFVSMPNAGAERDAAAQAMVESKALEGSELHLKAVLYVLSHAMQEQHDSLFHSTQAAATPRDESETVSELDVEIDDLEVGGLKP